MLGTIIFRVMCCACYFSDEVENEHGDETIMI